MDEDGGRIADGLGTGEWSGRGWLGTWWPRPTTWCGLANLLRCEQGSGWSSRHDLPVVQCAPIA